MAPPPTQDGPPLTLHRTVHGADYAAFLATFSDSASLAACQAAAGDMGHLHVSAWAASVEDLPPDVPGAPPAPCPPPADVTVTYYRRMAFSPVINEPWLPKLTMFHVTEIHALHGRPGARSPARMTGTATLRWSRWAQPAPVLDTLILARPVHWPGTGGDGEPATPGVAMTFSVTPHLPPWAVGPIKRLVLAGIADMFNDFSSRSLAWAVDAVPGATLIQGDAAAAGAVEEEVEDGGAHKAVDEVKGREDAAVVAAEA
jgi:hypothetical protein